MSEQNESTIENKKSVELTHREWQLIVDGLNAGFEESTSRDESNEIDALIEKIENLIKIVEE
ncbi:MAG: hypothetical protein Q8R55_05330 [Candidatus Taylorbacteria bacterium]|nr:hypothetical protein [Candidatus Taylorbacteria bacterium]